MALESATNIKAAIATAAADLTTALQDTVVTHTALEIRHPSHPLRKIEKLFLFNPATGVFTSDDAYIDASHAGMNPQKGSDKDVITDWLPLAFTSGDVEIAEPADIVLVFSRAVANADNITIGGAGSAGKSILSVTIVSATVTIVVSADYIAADVITVSGDFRTADNAKLVLTDESVTNNIV